jgi:SsrA-binding protein
MEKGAVMSDKTLNSNKSIVEIKKTSHDYEIIKTFTAGLMLKGWMVKSLRAGKMSASNGVYVKFMNNELFMMGMHLKPLVQANSFSDISETPTIKLLLTRKELNVLGAGQDIKGYTIVLTELHWKNGWVKAEIALAKGKKLHDKRQSLKTEQLDREADRAIKNREH